MVVSLTRDAMAADLGEASLVQEERGTAGTHCDLTCVPQTFVLEPMSLNIIYDAVLVFHKSGVIKS